MDKELKFRVGNRVLWSLKGQKKDFEALVVKVYFGAPYPYQIRFNNNDTMLCSESELRSSASCTI